jgi:hypothetical protein
MPLAASAVARIAPTGKPPKVGRDAGPLACEQFASTADAALHFVEDQQKPVLVAEFAQANQALRRHGAHAAFALDRLDHNGCGLGADCCLKCRMISKPDGIEPAHVGPEAFEIFLIATGRQRRQRPAMERTLERDDAVALRMA